MNHAMLLGWSGALLVAGAVASLAVARQRTRSGWVAFAFAAAAAVPLFVVVAQVFSSGPQPEVVLLRLKADMKFRDIAKLQQTSVNTVLGRYRYGLTRLRSMLNGEVDE